MHNGRDNFVQLAFDQVEDARALAQTVVETGCERLLVLDGDLTIVSASGSF